MPALAGLCLPILLAACSLSGANANDIPVAPSPTPTPAGPETLNICMGQEPQSLYLYGDNSQAARAVRQAIYDGPIDTAGYLLEPTILESLPNLANGGTRVQIASVSAGDTVVDANGVVTQLQPGMQVRPAGCRSGDCAVTYQGGELDMEQVVVTFKLRLDITWSDGTALTAGDSVYSFEVASDAATPGAKTTIERTASYEATDDPTVVWTGLPGYIDPGALSNFWTPLPRHAWEGTAPADLPESDAPSRAPLGWGPYIIDEWISGDRIRLGRNTNYWRAGEELPYFNTLNFLFIGEGAQAVDALVDGRCDLLLPSTNLDGEVERLQSMAEAGQAQLFFGPAGSWEHLDFGIQPLSLDDGFNVFNDSPDFFSDVRMRQAIARCVDRQALIDEFAFGQGRPPNSYLPPDHPLYNTNATAYAFDPAAAGGLLNELGWVMGGDGVRVAAGFPGALNDTRLDLTLTIADDERSLAIAHSLQKGLEDCGIALLIDARSADQVFAPGPEGPLFGRRFQLAQFAWPYGEQPACYLYLSEAIPGEDFETYRYGWGGWNLSGWSSAEFDTACQRAHNSLPEEQAYPDAQRQAQAVFAEQPPALPLFANVQVAAARADFCNFALEPGADLLANLEMLGLAEWCN